MLINHGYPAEHGPYYTEKPLVGPCQEQVIVPHVAIFDFSGTAIDCPLFLGRKPLYGQRRKGVFIYNIPSEITNDFLNGFR
jgi:hypothetical protein